MARPRDIYDEKAFESIGISDDLMFKSVFGRDARLVGRLLECVLERPVGEVEYIRGSHESRPEWDARTTTFDVYLRTSDSTLGEFEMQNSHKSELPLRLRTHLSNMDREAIHRGDKFKDARETVTVFICTFDPLGDGLRRYTVRRHVEETGKVFLDRQRGVLLNAQGSAGEVCRDLQLFLRYVLGYDGEDVMASDFVREIDRQVRANRSDWTWRRDYMTLEEKLSEAREEGIKQGIKQGVEQGVEQGVIQSVAALMRSQGWDAGTALVAAGVPDEVRPRYLEALNGGGAIQ